MDGSFDPSLLQAHLEDEGDYSCLPEEVTLAWEADNSKTLPVRRLVTACTSQREFHALCTCRGKRSLQAMITCFEVFVPIVRGKPALLERLSYDFVRRQVVAKTRGRSPTVAGGSVASAAAPRTSARLSRGGHQTCRWSPGVGVGDCVS